MQLDTMEVSSPVGPVTFAAQGGRLFAMGFSDRWSRVVRALQTDMPDVELRRVPCQGAIAQALERYFFGDIHALASIDVVTCGTGFQQEVWSALRTIPAGRTESYGAIARRLGRTHAAREVGAACGANRIWLAIPCHRVISADGRLSGYAGGVDRKRWLLAHEHRDAGALWAGAGVRP